jgi:hypothetical protein
MTAVVALLSGACNDNPGPGPGPVTTLVGQVTGKDAVDAVVAIVADGQTVTYYSCGGPTSVSTLTKWIEEATESSDGSISGQAGGWSMVGNLLDGTGEVTTAEGEMLSWHADPVQPGTLAGLFRADDIEGGRIGVVVTQPTSTATKSFQGVWVGSGTHPMAIVDSNPQEFSGEIVVQVDFGTGSGKQPIHLKRDAVSLSLSAHK